MFIYRVCTGFSVVSRSCVHIVLPSNLFSKLSVYIVNKITRSIVVVDGILLECWSLYALESEPWQIPLKQKEE